MGRLRQSGYPPTSQVMPRMPDRHYQCKDSSWHLPSKHGLVETLFQLVPSKTMRIVSVILGVQVVVNFCGYSRRLMHSKILHFKNDS